MSQTSSINQNIKEIQSMLTLVLHCANQDRAEMGMKLAEEKMQQLESLVLSHPLVTEEQIAGTVKLGRGPMWNMARQHLSNLLAQKYAA